MFGLFILGCTTIIPVMAQELMEAGKTEFTVIGVVRDQETHKKLENVTVALIGTVTNAEGVFSLKIPNSKSTSKLELSRVKSS